MFKIILTIGTIQSLAVFILFIKSKIVAVYLGPAGVGVVGTIDQFVQLAAFVSVFGLPAASIKFLSKSHSEGDAEFKRSYAGFFKFLFLLSAAGAFLTIGAILLKPDILGEEFEKYKLFLILGLLTLPTFTLSALFVNVFAAAQKFRASSILVLITNAVLTIAAVAGVIYAGIFGLYIGSILAGVLVIVGVMIYLREKFGLPVYDRWTNIRREFKNNPVIFSTALLFYFAAITASLSYLAARYAVLENFGEVEAGLLHGVMVLSFAFGTALYPAINIYLNPIVNRNIEKAIKIQQVVQFQRKLALILSLAALPILMFPKLMLTILFSAEFAGVSQLVYLFVLSQFIVQLAGVYQSLLIGLDDVKSYTLITSIGQIISACLCLVLTPYFGIKGVAFAFLTGNSLNFAASLIRLIVKYNFAVPLDISFLIGYIFSILLLTGLTSNQFAEWDIAVVSAKIVFLLLFGASLFLFLNKEEKASLANLRRKVF
ncbi:MAG: polysaccharide biosynthesis C-terminal domain-containing protein [Pyrinomonadaceae bacterium]